MSFPYQIGGLQLILVLIAFLAICALLQSFKRFSFANCFLPLVVSVVALALLYATLAIQAYASLSSDVLVAHVHETAFSNSTGPAMSVELVLYDTSGRATSDKTYEVLGNEWTLQGDIVKVSSVLNLAGLHSGYKLTRLEGRFDDPSLERHAAHTVVELGGGDDGFFQVSHSLNSLIAPFIDAEYGNGVIAGPGSFNVYVSQTGLWAKEI